MAAEGIELAILYWGERKRLHRLIQRIIGNGAAVEDVAQDAFLKLNNRPVGPSDHSLLFRTAQNLAIDHVRARQVRLRYATQAAAQEGEEQPSPDRALEARQRLNALLEALKALPKRTQQIFLMNRIDGLTKPEIAKRLNVSVSLVEKEMVQALSFCRAWQKEHDKA